MPVPDALRRLTRIAPKTGRHRRESGAVVNTADTDYARSLLDPTSVVLRKQGYFFQDTRLDVSNNDVFHYLLRAPSDKHVVIFNRDLRCGEGPVVFDTIVGATFTDGTPIIPTNLYTGGPAAGMTVQKGLTDVSGGTVIPADYLFGAGNREPTAAESGLPTILPPDTEIIARITNDGAGTNPGIRFALALAEIDIPDDIAII